MAGLGIKAVPVNNTLNAPIDTVFVPSWDCRGSNDSQTAPTYWPPMVRCATAQPKAHLAPFGCNCLGRSTYLPL